MTTSYKQDIIQLALIKMQFKTKGHENVLGTHYNTLEFTKDAHLTEKGDCIIGVNSDFNFNELKELKGKIKITLLIDNIKDELIAEINQDFEHKTEMVIRKSDFKDKRTFAINATKAAKGISRELIEKMKDPTVVMDVIVESIGEKE